ncbi:MAG TPA: prenyltransferase/squalene oxidase repeat-containing protein [Candidatus Elarobacter sp.]|jgi:hypothetical protein
MTGTSGSNGSRRADRARDALRAAARYVIEAQQPDGAWLDFELDRTPSDAWVTGYAGLGLLAARAALPGAMPSADAALRGARAWLLRACEGRGGWGFNAHAPVDADSTALATTFLASTGGAPAAAYDTLRRHRHDDGGYSCYERFSDVSTWAVSHGDVSATALRALLTEPARDTESIERCARYLAEQQLGDGSWPSFWYTTRAYSVAFVLDALHALGARHRLDAREALRENGAALLALHRLEAAVRFACDDVPRDDAFALALALETVARFGDAADAAALLDDLLALQRIDGRFTAAVPFMRPDPWNYEDGDPQASVLDPFGLFTTATALRALAAVVLRASTPEAVHA